ncbi:MAG: hypothetical protein IJS50_02785 [Desulfovibrio sp.]|nr:hypothetical protein [Desulfovibrio sp.]
MPDHESLDFPETVETKKGWPPWIKIVLVLFLLFLVFYGLSFFKEQEQNSTNLH